MMEHRFVAPNINLDDPDPEVLTSAWLPITRWMPRSPLLPAIPSIRRREHHADSQEKSLVTDRL
jgi:hypothetical protein